MRNTKPSAQSMDNVIPEGETKSIKRKRKAHILFYVIILLLLVAGFGSAGYFYQKYEALRADPTAAVEAQEQEQAQQEVSDLVSQVGKMIILPTNETPTVATVTNADQLRDQKFFANAEDGDKLIVYTQAMEAILYRPSINKIVEVGPIIGNQPTSDDAAASTTASSTGVSASSTSTNE